MFQIIGFIQIKEDVIKHPLRAVIDFDDNIDTGCITCVSDERGVYKIMYSLLKEDCCTFNLNTEEFKIVLNNAKVSVNGKELNSHVIVSIANGEILCSHLERVGLKVNRFS